MVSDSLLLKDLVMFSCTYKRCEYLRKILVKAMALASFY